VIWGRPARRRLLAFEKMDKSPDKYRYPLICIFLVVVTGAVFWPVLNYQFVKYDDDGYVTNNRHIRLGFSWQAVRWAFTSGHASNWHPVTWLSHMLDYKLFGLRAGAHHLVNLLFHTANTLLLFVVLRRMTGALWASAFVAAIFGLHPLHVESVAWVSERKDVLSTFFWMLTMWAYVRYAERPKAGRYLLVLTFFVLGLMAKPMLVTLPFVLLLLDYWPLERIGVRQSGLQNPVGQKGFVKKPFLHLVMEKAPFLGFSVMSSVVTFLVQRSSGAVSPVAVIDIKSRISNAFVSYINYIWKMIWPRRLAVFYPHPGSKLPVWQVVVAVLLLAGITVWVIRLAQNRKYLLVGWLWYIGTLVPVIGLVQVGSQAMADRYTYVPLTGLFIIIAWGVREFVAGRYYLRIVSAILAVVVLSAATVCTRVQLKYWQNSIILFEHALDVSQEDYFIYNNLAYALKSTGKVREAIKYFSRSLELNPNEVAIHNNLANVLADAGRIDEAIEHFNISLRLRPNSAEVHNNLGNLLVELGRVDEAIGHYREAMRLEPKFFEAYYNLAVALAKKGKNNEAIEKYRETLRLDPDHVDAMSNLGFELAQQGKFDEAVKYYKKAITLEPGDIVAHGRLGLALASLGKIDEAVREFRIVLSASPEDVEMHCNLGILLERQGKITEAINEYRQGLKINPNDAKARGLLEAAMAKQKSQ